MTFICPNLFFAGTIPATLEAPMAANLYDNKMGYRGEIPWHGLGTQFSEAMTAAEAIEASGLGYAVEKDPLFRKIQRTQEPKFPGITPIVEEAWEETGAFATVNRDNGKVLGIVRSAYEVLQNRDAFSFFDVLLAESGARYETAGALGDGERMWLLAKMPESFEPLLGDRVDQFCLLSNSHDGFSGLSVTFTPIRVVCQNTLTAALRGSASTVSLRHTSSIKAKLDQSAMVLRDYRDHYRKLGEVFGAFAAFKITDEWLDAYMDALFGAIKDDSTPSFLTRRERKVAAFMEHYEKGMGVTIDGVAGSAWGAYNAATEFADYEYPSRKGTDRTASLLFGTIAGFKQRAFDAALATVPTLV